MDEGHQDSPPRFSRREWLQMLPLIVAAAFLSDCAPPSPATPEITRERKVTCVRDWQPRYQIIQEVVNPDTGQVERVKSCSEPKRESETASGSKPDSESGSEGETGLILDTSPFTWDETKLNQIKIRGRDYPLLSALPLLDIDEGIVEGRRRQSEKLHADPGMVETELIKKIESGEVEAKPPQPFRVLQVDLNFLRRSFWAPNPDGSASCQLKEDRITLHKPEELQSQLIQAVETASRQNITFEVVDHMAKIREKQLPYTSDRTRAPEDLINMYPQVVDYSILSQWAKEAGANVVFVWGNPTTGMSEFKEWEGIQIFGFNCERGLDCALHSFCHFIEDGLWFMPYYGVWAGRNDEYDIPYYVNINEQEEAMKSQTYASAGLGGTVHLTPNGLGHYNYSSTLLTLLPGREDPIDASLWNYSEVGYLQWWLGQMPDVFFQVFYPKQNFN